VPGALREALAGAMKSSGIPPPESEERWGLALEALKGVWASKYNDRWVAVCVGGGGGGWPNRGGTNRGRKG
jgi:hypothetical protein